MATYPVSFAVFESLLLSQTLAFNAYWRNQMKADPENFPAEFESYEDWYEQFQSWLSMQETPALVEIPVPPEPEPILHPGDPPEEPESPPPSE